MDKNKSAYKLKGLPPIYYTNLDKSEDRKTYMEEQFFISILMLKQKGRSIWKINLNIGK